MQHLSDAYRRADDFLSEWIDSKPQRSRLLIVKDVRSMLRVILWCAKNELESSSNEIDSTLTEICPNYWSKSVIPGQFGDHPDKGWQDDAWEQARPHENTTKLRILEKHLTKSGWFEAPAVPPWTTRAKNAPVIVLFYSFKGGVGRSTALAAIAMHLASVGDRVAVLDADLDAPGVGNMLAGHDGTTAEWGIVDYLLEQRLLKASELPTDDYYHRYVAPSGIGEDILVYPAGTFNGAYVDKLARIDYGNPVSGTPHPFVALLHQIRRELAPRWILIDARSGLGEVSGFLTGGLCHVHVLLGTLAEASWRGLELILDRLGGDRVRMGRSQAECLLAASMLPRSDESLFQELVARFTERARDAFSAYYYAEPDSTGDNLWTLSDLESDDAPHVPVVLPYEERLATFRDLNEVAEGVLLREGPYRDLAGRLWSSYSL